MLEHNKSSLNLSEFVLFESGESGRPNGKNPFIFIHSPERFRIETHLNDFHCLFDSSASSMTALLKFIVVVDKQYSKGTQKPIE